MSTTDSHCFFSFDFQLFLVVFTVLLVYFTETINELAAQHWQSFSKQQYFDSNGLFISTVFSIPILLNCMLMIVSIFLQIFKFLLLTKAASQIRLWRFWSKRHRYAVNGCESPRNRWLEMVDNRFIAGFGSKKTQDSHRSILVGVKPYIRAYCEYFPTFIFDIYTY